MSANYLRETIDLVKQIETRFLELASRLHYIQLSSLWKGQYENFGEFVDASGINRTFASKLVAIHREYVIDKHVSSTKLTEAGYEKLYTAIPLLGQQDVETVVEKAKLLTLAELREELREDKHADCTHEETISICTHCHKKV